MINQPFANHTNHEVSLYLAAFKKNIILLLLQMPQLLTVSLIFQQLILQKTNLRARRTQFGLQPYHSILSLLERTRRCHQRVLCHDWGADVLVWLPCIYCGSTLTLKIGRRTENKAVVLKQCNLKLISLGHCSQHNSHR